MSAVVGEDGEDFVRESLDKLLEEVTGCSARGFLDQTGEGELGSAVDGDEEIEFALFGAHLSQIDVEVADGSLPASGRDHNGALRFRLTRNSASRLERRSSKRKTFGSRTIARPIATR